MKMMTMHFQNDSYLLPSAALFRTPSPFKHTHFACPHAQGLGVDVQGQGKQLPKESVIGRLREGVGRERG